MTAITLTPKQKFLLMEAMKTASEEGELLIFDARTAKAMVRKGVLEPLGGEYGYRFKLTSVGRSLT